MEFTYEGFTHEGHTRCFFFRGVCKPVATFAIEVDLSLFTQNRVAVQEGPMFCLQLLTTASIEGTDWLDRFHRYQVVGEDFRSLLVEREKKAALKASKKPSRRPFRKPAFGSNLRLGKSPA